MTAGGTLAALLAGSPFNDTITGTVTTADSLSGGAGNDSLTALFNNTVMTGGAGSDTFAVATAVTAFVNDLSAGDIITAAGTSVITATATGPWAATNATVIAVSQIINTAGFTIDASLATTTSTMGFTINGSTATAMTLTGSTNADSITGGTGNDLITAGAGDDSIIGGAGSDTINLTELVPAIDTIVFSGATVAPGGAPTAISTANGSDIILGFGSADTLNLVELFTGLSLTAAAAISAPAASSLLTTDTVSIINTDGTAANLSLLGTAVVTDWTNLTQVQTYLSEQYTTAPGLMQNIFVINNTGGSNTTSYVYALSDVAAITIDAGELVLVGTVTHAAGVPLLAANTVIV